MIESRAEPDTVGIIKIGLVILVKGRNHDELRSVTVTIFTFQSSDNVMDRPSSSNVKLLAVVSDLTLSQVSGVGFPQLVESFLRQSNLDTRHQVITIEQGCRTIQTSVTSTDRGELQRLKTLTFVEVDTTVLCICVRDFNVGEYLIPQVISVSIHDSQTFVIDSTNKRVRVATCQHRVVRNFTSKPCKEENRQCGFSATGGKGDCQQIQFIIGKLL